MSTGGRLRPAENPFASHRVESLGFVPQGTSWSAIIERLESLRWRAAVVGPPGTGKTTFLEELAERLDHHAELVRVPGSSPRPLSVALAGARRGVSSGRLILLDSAEQLRPLAWRYWCWCARKARGVVITVHRPGRLPTLLETRTSAELLDDLVGQLAPEELPGLRPALEALHHHHRGDARGCLRDLYDLFSGRYGEAGDIPAWTSQVISRGGMNQIRSPRPGAT